MKRMCLAALTAALGISTMAVAIDVASAASRAGVYRGGVHRAGVGRVGVGRVGVGYGRAGYGWGGRGAGYRGYGLVSAAVSGTALGSGYYASGGYGASAGYNAYATADYGTGGGDTYILHGTEISGSDAAAYCAQQFRSYDAESGTFLAYSGERVSCPQQ